MEKKEKYTQATEEKVKAVLNVLAKEYNVNIRELSQPKSEAGVPFWVGLIVFGAFMIFCAALPYWL